MAKKNIGISAGIIPYAVENNKTYFLMGHPSNKPKDYWLYMRGMVEDFETMQDTAVREFKEECGRDISKYKEKLVYLGLIKQREGKSVAAYALKVDASVSDTLQLGETDGMHSNMCCGGTVPEIDGYQWMCLEQVIKTTNETNIPFFVNIVRNYKN